jgi:hypothetical protein
MPCRIAGNAILCSRTAEKRCIYCGRPSSKLCDFRLTGAKAGNTCDAPMCANCTTSGGPDVDYCRPHAKMINDKHLGLYQKFIVKRSDGSHRKGRKHHECIYFVLDLVHDEFSGVALRAYLKACKRKFPMLARDIAAVLEGRSPQSLPDWRRRP